MQSNQPLAREIQFLREKLGSRMTLDKPYDKNPYHIITELEISGEFYACLLPQHQKEEDIYIYRYHWNNDDYVIQAIEEDEEWERVADAYDEWLYYRHKH